MGATPPDLAMLASTALSLLSVCTPPPDEAAGNVLVVVLDDVGVHDVDLLGLASDPASTPRISQLASEGVVFTNAIAQPNCSPSRASLLTGLRPVHSGVENLAIQQHPLPFEHWTIPERLPDAFASAAIGKWHLSSNQQGTDAPLEHGFDHASIAWANLGDYYAYDKYVDGDKVAVSTYATTDQVDDALSWIDVQDGPWLCYLAFSAAHEPFQEPPPALGGSSFGGGGVANPWRQTYKRMIRALDLELGRLLDSLDPDVLERTTIWIVGDNGTPPLVSPPELTSSKVKGTVYQGGIHVPLLACGHGVAARGTTCEALVEINDLFATVLELAGAEPGPGGDDSVSLVPYLADPDLPSLRSYTFAHRLKANGGGEPLARSTVREGDLKLHRSEGVERLFDLAADPLEEDDRIDDPTLFEAADHLRNLLDGTFSSPGLFAPPGAIAVELGGDQELVLLQPVRHAGSTVLLLGSASEGPGGLLLDRLALPIPPDAYTWHTLVNADSPPLPDGLGTLGADGLRTARWSIGPKRLGPLAGTRLRHVALVFGPAGNVVEIAGPVDLVLR